MSRMRRILRRLLLVLLSLTVLAVLIEIILRLFTDLGIQVLQKDETIGQRYRPGFEGELYVAESDRRVRMRFNRDGFRGPDWSRERVPGKRRMAVLGDSFTVALAVDEKETMVARLSDRLGQGWEVFNFGISGFSTGQSLLCWREVARDFRPDIVLLNFSTWNDLADNCRRLTSGHRPYFDLDEAGAPVLRPMNALRVKMSRWASHSRFYVWQKYLFKRVRSATRGLSAGHRILDSEPDEDVRYAWRVTETLIALLHREVVAAGARFVFVSGPSIVQYDAGAWEAVRKHLSDEETARFDFDYPERRLGDILTRHRIDGIALLPAFKRARKDGPINFGGGHWNERGNALAADVVHTALVERDLLPR